MIYLIFLSLNKLYMLFKIASRYIDSCLLLLFTGQNFAKAGGVGFCCIVCLKKMQHHRASYPE